MPVYRTASEEETIALGERLARDFPPKQVVLLIGQLGAGKTTLAKGIVKGLGAADPDEVSSPTFTLIHEYGNQGRLYHIDLYRLDQPREVATLGLEDLFDRQAIVLIEWGERFPQLLPVERTEIRIQTIGDDNREIEVKLVPEAVAYHGRSQERPMSAAGNPAVTPERILQMMWGYAPPIILATATRLGFFDALEKGPQTASEVAARTGTAERGVRPVLNALVGLQFLTKNARQQYSLTPESATFLVSGKPGYLGTQMQHVGQDLIAPWLALPGTVKTGQPARGVNREAGAEFFEQLVVGLFPMNYPLAQAAGKALNVAAATKPLKILDIAAGSGVWGIGIAEQAPGSTVTAVDWPNVLEVTKRFAAEHRMADRFSYIGGDMQAVDFGTGYDLAILGHILHSEGEKKSRTLLKKCARSLAPGGSIAVAEFLVNEERTGPPMGLFFAINMLVNTDEGDTFSFEELSQWLGEAGFSKPRKIDPGGPASVIVAQKA